MSWFVLGEGHGHEVWHSNAWVSFIILFFLILNLALELLVLNTQVRAEDIDNEI
jgi:hypothetical protein